MFLVDTKLCFNILAFYTEIISFGIIQNLGANGGSESYRGGVSLLRLVKGVRFFTLVRDHEVSIYLWGIAFVFLDSYIFCAFLSNNDNGF